MKKKRKIKINFNNSASHYNEIERKRSFTGIGCGVTMVSLGIYLHYKKNLDEAIPPIEAKYTWFPVVCIFGFTICCTLGYLVVPWVCIVY